MGLKNGHAYCSYVNLAVSLHADTNFGKIKVCVWSEFDVVSRLRSTLFG